MIEVEKIPDCLKKLKQWVLWKTIGDPPRKCPYRVNGVEAKAGDPATWSTFKAVHDKFRMGGYLGIGFEFHTTDEFCGIDLDGCRNKETGKVEEWAREIIKTFDSYSEVSPSGEGVKIWVRARSPFDNGRKTDKLPFAKIGEKTPGVELYDHARFFCVTGWRLATSPEVEARQAEVDAFANRFWPDSPTITVGVDWHSDAAVIDRARKYLAKLPAAVSGQGGHKGCFHAACCLVLGFGLPESTALDLLREYSQICQPPWSEKELLHKIKSASKQSGERNYLRNAKSDNWGRLSEGRRYTEPVEKPEEKCEVKTFGNCADTYLMRLREGKETLVSTGLSELDYALGGGLSRNEFVCIGARSGFGKSLLCQQMLHQFALTDPTLLLSIELPESVVGKRVLQFASDVPQSEWTTNSQVEKDMLEHLSKRNQQWVAFHTYNLEKVVEIIRETVREIGVQFIAVDYLQELKSKAKDEVERIGHAAAAFAELAHELNVVIVAACQMNRECEKRTVNIPKNSDLMGSGHIEQAADVILFSMPLQNAQQASAGTKAVNIYVTKNRNRETRQFAFQCQLDGDRQRMVDGTMRRYESGEAPASVYRTASENAAISQHDASFGDVPWKES